MCNAITFWSNIADLCLNTIFMALWRACNLTSFSPGLTGPVDYLFVSRYEGPGFKTPGGTYVDIFGDPDAIDHFCGLVCGGLRPEPSLMPTMW